MLTVTSVVLCCLCWLGWIDATTFCFPAALPCCCSALLCFGCCSLLCGLLRCGCGCCCPRPCPAGARLVLLVAVARPSGPGEGLWICPARGANTSVR